MSRVVLATACALSLLALALAPRASAQTPARRPPPRGDVSGLEMTLEGPTTVARGGTARFFVTLHQVLHERDLAPAPHAEVRVSSDLSPGRPLATVNTDADGRALVTFDVVTPHDETAMSLVFDARLAATSGRAGVRRRFELSLTIGPRVRIDAVAAGGVGEDGDRVRVVGRLTDVVTGLPRGGATVSVGLTTGARREATTGPSGLFVTWLPRPPAGSNGAGIVLSVADEPDVDTHVTQVALSAGSDDVPAPAVLVRATPSARLVRDLAPVDVEVEARTTDGAPIAHAAVRRDSDPPPDEHHPRVETDAEGHAHLSVRPGEVAGPGEVADVALRFLVTPPGMTEQVATTTVRVARVAFVVTLAAEGGALVPRLPSRLYARVVAPDGTPAPVGTAVTLTAARLGTLHGTTDPSGVARFDATLADAAAGAEDDCGGATALSVETGVAGGTRAECVPIDPDAALRVRLASPEVAPGTTLVANVTRAPSVARMPLVVSALAVSGGDASGVLVPVARVLLAPGANDAHLDLPAGLRGLVLVRARPVAAASGEEARGGTALAWVRDAAPAAVLTVEDERARIASAGAVEGETREAAVLAVRAGEAGTVASALADTGPLVARLRASTGLLVEARLAGATPEDESAPAVLRGGALVGLPAREDPTHDAVLRDPFRARARFVSGRIALVVRALEKYVDARLPDGLDDVSAQTPRGARVLSRELIEAIVGSSDTGNEGPRGLGGAPLTMDSLVAIDPQIDFDHLARRLTRARLFRVLVALRTLVRHQGLDLRWAWRGEPAALLRALTGETDDDSGEQLVTREQLFDGWGHPFVIVPARAQPSSPTVVRLDPLPGWQLVSAGPDGRAGTADDVRDPFGRVLSSGSPYAVAVGEDDLLARASDVALGRARLESLAPLFDVELPSWESDEPGESVATSGLDDVPAPLPPPPPAYERPGAAHVAASPLLAVPSGGATTTLAGDPEGRTLAAVAFVASSRGGTSVARADLVSHATLLSFATAPARLRVGEPLTVPLHFLALSGAPGRHVRVRAEGADASLSSSELSLPPGREASLALRLSARAPGAVRVTVEADGARPLVLRLSADDGGVLRQQVAGAWVADGHALSVELPGDATSARTELVVTDPSWLAHDPAAASLAEDAPALVAWADTLAGRTPDDDARVRLLGSASNGPVPGGLPALDTACALVVWSATSEDDVAANAARIAHAPMVAGSGGSIDGDDGTRLDAAVLTALAAGASGAAADASDTIDPVAAHVAALRDSLRSTIALHAGEPAVLVRAAAALLLADARDAAGLAMLALAEAAASDVHGGLVLRDADGAPDAAATAALAIAAQQSGEERVRRGAALGFARLLLRALAGDEESRFWALAAGAYGALGTTPSPHVTVSFGGRARELALTGGVARVSLGAATHVDVSRPGSPVLARVVTRYARPARAREEAPLRLALEGDDGTFGNLTGLELTVTAQGDRAVRAPVVEVALPAGAVLEGLNALVTSGGVSQVEPPDARGLVRIHLATLQPAQHVVLPIAARWVARGTARGFAVVAYDAGRPTVMTVMPERTIDVR